MASTEIQIVNISNLEKIQSFLNDSAYKEVLENSENFNTRLCIERRLRMPFLDPQTGVAQNHCTLFMKQKQRMPGFREGQIYSYPSSRWRKPKRQYLLHHNNYKAFSFRDTQCDVSAIPSIDGSSLSASADNDSKDSHRNDEKEWFYDEVELNHVEDFEEIDSDLDFDESYSGRRRKRKYASKKCATGVESTPAKRGRRGRKKGSNDGGETRRRPGPQPLPPNTGSSPLNAATTTTTITAAATTTTTTTEDQQITVLIPEQQKILDAENTDAEKNKKPKQRPGAGERSTNEKADPSPYCDFCLGDARENKKTCLPEELVSCSDCGRSGHPSCLQFTPNMIVSVKRYRWQCIECKYCSICGTSDNDDQLLFCDDCDRGYHMYCLSPPLTDPPEGSWSCKLCLEEFHSGKKNIRKLLFCCNTKSIFN